MSNFGTIIDDTLHPAPRAFMFHGRTATSEE